MEGLRECEFGLHNIAQLLARIDGLAKAVKQARETANETPIDAYDTTIGAAVFNHLLA